jgi:hypothetical protein
MPHRRALGLLLLLGREIEGIAQKDVRIPHITRIVGHDRIESFGKSNFLHEQSRVCLFPARAMISSNNRASKGSKIFELSAGLASANASLQNFRAV